MSGNRVLQKLPPHVVRELRRHIAPPKSPSATTANPAAANIESSSSSSSSWQQNRGIVLACTTLTVLAFVTPLGIYYWIKPLSDREAGLTAPQNRRGPFLNSGSRDIGRDGDWDSKTGTHRLKKGYGNLEDDNDDDAATDTARDNTKKNALPAEFLAMAPNEMKKVEDKIVAFARGQGRNN